MSLATRHPVAGRKLLMQAIARTQRELDDPLVTTGFARLTYAQVREIDALSATAWASHFQDGARRRLVKLRALL